MHDFVDACKEAGFESKRDLFPSYKWHIRALFREILVRVYTGLHRYFPFLLCRKEALIVPANGCTLIDNTFPYFGSYEIIPFLWDVWPYSWEKMFQSFALLDVRIVFVTSSQVCDKINKESSIKAIFIPEGIKASLYHNGVNVADRPYDVLEIGRQHSTYHRILTDLLSEGVINRLQNSNIHSDGTLDDKDVAFTNEELYSIMSTFKIMICFPQCDTNPNRAGKIETLTQRYWEGMLSGCLLIGRAPKELIDLIGYDPVLNVDWKDPQTQLKNVLSGIHNYQGLIQRNLQTAYNYASWSHRMKRIKDELTTMGYVY